MMHRGLQRGRAIWPAVWLGVVLAFGFGRGPVSAATAEEQAFRTASKLLEDRAYPLAERQFATFAATYPASPLVPQALLYQAQAMLQTGKAREAIPLLRDGEKGAGALMDQYAYWLGEAEYQAGDFQAAAQTFGRLLTEHTGSPRRLDAILALAFARFRLGELRQAADLLGGPEGLGIPARTQAPSDPRVVEAHLILAEARLELGEFERAREPLAWLSSRPLGAEDHWRRQYLEARVFLAAREYDSALKVVTNLYTIPVDGSGGRRAARVIALHGDVFRAQDRTDESIRVYERNLSTNAPPEWRREALLRIVQLAQAAGRPAEAMSRLEVFLSEPNLPPSGLDPLRLTLGELRLRAYLDLAPAQRLAATQSLAGAKQQLLLVRTNDSAGLLGRASFGLGWCAWEEFRLTGSADRLGESRAAFQTAVERLPASPEHAIARFKLADSAFAAADAGTAITNYLAVLSDYGGFPEVRRAMGNQALYQVVRSALQLGTPDRAVESLNEILRGGIAAGPLTDRTLLLVSRDLAERGRAEDARELLLQFRARFPDSSVTAEVDLALARSEIDLGRWPEALGRYDAWMARHTNHSLVPLAEFDRAWVRYRTGDVTNALAGFTNFVQRFPLHELAPLAQNWVADHHFNHRQFESAEEGYQRVFLNTNWPVSELTFRAQAMAGRSAFERGNVRDARTYFTGLLNTIGGVTNAPAAIAAEAWLLLGDIIFTQYNNDPAKSPDLLGEAINAFTRVTKDFPGDPRASEAWGRLGDAFLQAAAANAAQLDAAGNAYSNAVASARATLAVRSLAQIGLGKIEERRAEGLTGAQRRERRDAALLHYMMVLEAGNLRGTEPADPQWLKLAGIEASRLAEEDRRWDLAKGIYKRLLAEVPALRVRWERALERVEASRGPGDAAELNR